MLFNIWLEVLQGQNFLEKNVFRVFLFNSMEYCKIFWPSDVLKKRQKKYKLGLVEIKWNYVFVKHKYRCNWTQTQIRTGLELPTTAGLELPTGLPRLELYANSEQGVSWHSGNYRVYMCIFTLKRVRDMTRIYRQI